MSNSVELKFDTLSDWTIEKIDEFFSIKNMVDMGLKQLSSGAVKLLQKGEAMAALASVFSARNAGDIAARLAVALPGAQLLAITQVGTALRLVVAHESASCDAIGRATFSVIGDTLGSFVGPAVLAALPIGRLTVGKTIGASIFGSGVGGLLGRTLWDATKALSPDDKTCYADLFGLHLGFQTRASDGTLGTRPLGDLQAGYLQRPPDVSLTRNASEVVTLSSNVGTPVSRTYASVNVAADASSYVVQRYDTLWSIAQANGWNFNELLNANPQLSDPNLIHIGQVIHGLGPVAASNTANTSTRTGDAFIGPPAPGTGAATGTDGLAIQGVSWQTTVDPASLAQGTTFYDGTTGDTATDGVRPGNIELGHVAGTLQAVEAAAGALLGQQTSGGAAGGIGGAGALLNNAGAATPLLPVDPLVLDLNDDRVQLSDIANSRAFFDADNDGPGADGRPTREHIGWVKAETTRGQAFNTDGIVVHDLDGNGVIDGIRETLSEYYAGTPGAQGAAGARTFANGFAALASLDSNADQRFTRDDSAWSGLRVWVDDNADGLSFKDDNGNGRRDAGELSELHTWDELGITSIQLAAQTESGLVAQGNDVLARGVFTRNGQDAEALALRFMANPDGHTFTPVSAGAGIAGGIVVATESAATGAVNHSYTSRNADAAFNENLDVRALGVNHLYGGAGRDTLQGDAGANWLDGGAGADVFNAGAGDDVLLIDAADRAQDIHAGEGRDVIQVIGDEGVSLNMAQAEAEAFVGGDGADQVVAGGRSTVYLRGGAGDDVLIGGAANDIVSGEDGNDFIDGGAGNDLLRGHRGRDEIAGGSGDDVLDGGADDDWLRGGAGADVLIGGAGDDRLDGGEGVDVAEYAGTHNDYEITRVDARTWRVTDVRTGIAGSDTLVDVEKLSFKDWSRISLGDAHPMAAGDVVRTDADGRTLSRTGVQRIAAGQLLRNDQDMQGQTLRIAEVLDARGGTVTLGEQGDVLFTPQPGYGGVMSFRYRVVDASGNATPTVIDETSGNTAQTKATVRLWTADLPADPLLLQEDYLSDANVIPVWRDYTGRGLRIAMVESTGPFSTQPEVFDYRHPDLKANVDAVWLNAPALNPALSLPQPTNNHATMVAGIIGSARNGQGGVGVAYEASLAGGYLPRTDLDRPENRAAVLRTFGSFKDYDIVNNSWQNLRQGAQPTTPVSFRDALALGRSGLGTAVVFAAGNQRDKGMDTNLDWTTADRGVIVVAGTASNPDLGAFVQGIKPYSTPGASILLAAPGANIESVSRELFTDNGSTFNAGQERGDGTSFAAPIVSGVVALMLQANPGLGYRDIQAILALSARQTGESSASDWAFNGAARWNGGGMHVSHDFGYGMVDALAAVRLAETWQQQGTYYNEQHLHAESGALARAVSDDGAMLSSTLTLGSGLAVENAEVTLELSHQRWSDLVVKLVSPSGTSSVLINRPGKAPAGVAGSTATDGGNEAGSFTLRLNTQHLRGESSAGAWTLQVFDAAAGATGTLARWSLDVYGAAASSDDLYVYTDEFATLPGGQRAVLSDSNGGIDMINASAVTRDSRIDLSGGTASRIAGRELVLAGDIEQAFAGDGRDILIGSALDNTLRGGRGDDDLFGGAGRDILDGGKGNDRLAGGAGQDRFVIERDPGSTDTLADFVSGDASPEKIVLRGFDTLSDFSQLTLLREGSDTRVLLPDGQSIVVLQTTGSLHAGHFEFQSAASAYAGGGSPVGDAFWGDTLPGTPVPGSNTVQGGVNAETLNAPPGGARIVGADGNDILIGDYSRDSDDLMYGGAGDDAIHAGGGFDVLVGGSGEDFMDASSGSDLLILDGDTGAVNGAQFWFYGTRHGDAGADIFKVLRSGGGAAWYGSDAQTEFWAPNVISDFNPDEVGELIDLSSFAWIRSMNDLRITDLKVGNRQIARVSAVSPESSVYLNLVDVRAAQLGADDFRFAPYVPRPIVGTALNEALTGDAGANVFDARIGTHAMTGRTGDDSYLIDSMDDTIVEQQGGGFDAVESCVSYQLGEEVEMLTLVGNSDIDASGNAHSNRLYGNAGHNRIDGGRGADFMRGGAGDDTYVVDNVGDRIDEAENEGTDTVESSLSTVLGADLENLVLLGQAAINGTGNFRDNRITGNAAANILRGGAGQDQLDGAAGDDIYRFAAGAGQDIITDSDATPGNTDTIAFDEGVLPSQVTLGKAGQDLLVRFGPGDQIVVRNWFGADASKVEQLSFADGTVWDLQTLRRLLNQAPVLSGALASASAFKYQPFMLQIPAGAFSDADSGDALRLSASLADGSPLPAWLSFDASTRSFSGTPMQGGTLGLRVTATDAFGATASGNFSLQTTLAASAMEGTDAANTLKAPSTSTQLYGLGGSDTLRGGAGADSLYGGDQIDYMYGGAGNDFFDGGAGDDKLYGEGGSDTYYFFRGMGRDTITEDDPTPGAVDVIMVAPDISPSDIAIIRTQSDLFIDIGKTAIDGVKLANPFRIDSRYDVEEVRFADGTRWTMAEIVARASGVPTAGADRLYGSLGADRIDGLDGKDGIYGLGGNDVLLGGAGNDSLQGGDGDDVLDGGPGSDGLQGGAGSDRYLLYRGGGQDEIQESDATPGNVDVIQCLAGITYDQLWFSRKYDDLEISIIGTSDRMVLYNWFYPAPGTAAYAASRVEQLRTDDGHVLQIDASAQKLVQAMAAFAPPKAGQTTLPVSYQAALAPVLAANWT